MATPQTALSSALASLSQDRSTNAILSAMIGVSEKVSDLIFSPNRPPQVKLNGKLVAVPGQAVLSADDTTRVARDLIGENQQAQNSLREKGSADLSYSIPGFARFRVNIFSQRNSYAIVMRVIPQIVPTFEALKLPSQLGDVVNLINGIVLVTGPTGSGKSSTLAAMIDKINVEKSWHILTIEDPIEFVHLHKSSTIHQRELHADTPSFSLALRAALRQAPELILVGEMRDRETIEIALEAAETGHLVMSTLHTIDAAKTVERIIGTFPIAEQHIIRQRLSRSFRYIISQRLLPRKDKAGRVAAIEILKSTMRTREYIEKGEVGGKTILDAMRDGDLDGMQCFDGVIEKLIREGIIDLETGMNFATNPGNLRLSISDIAEQTREEESEFEA